MGRPALPETQAWSSYPQNQSFLEGKAACSPCSLLSAPPELTSWLVPGQCALRFLPAQGIPLLVVSTCLTRSHAGADLGSLPRKASTDLLRDRGQIS